MTGFRILNEGHDERHVCPEPGSTPGVPWRPGAAIECEGCGRVQIAYEALDEYRTPHIVWRFETRRERRRRTRGSTPRMATYLGGPEDR
jgi:hypothetical protein